MAEMNVWEVKLLLGGADNESLPPRGYDAKNVTLEKNDH